MNIYKPTETNFIGIIKKQFTEFIKNSQVITEESKRKLITELGGNWYDERFDATDFLNDAVGYEIALWQERNFELAKLWKEVAVNNASKSNEPFKVADETVSQFMKSFNIQA